MITGIASFLIMSINEKNFFCENKKINVSNTTSLVNLKAELFKKKQDAIKSRSATKMQDFDGMNLKKNMSDSKWNQKAKQLDQRIRNSIKIDKNTNCLKNSEDNAIEKELKRSKENLERKTKLYEEKLKNAYESLMGKGESDDEEKKDDDLIDFERKVMDASKKGLKLFDGEESDDLAFDQDKMVEYVDSFGRTRYCKRQEREKIEKFNERELLRRKLDRDLNKDVKKDFKSSQYSDLYADFVKPFEEPKNESKDSRYQHVSEGEIREHGTSYYQFSLDEQKRREEMKELEKLREETVIQRKKADEMIEKRNAGLKQRLLKLAKRKGLLPESDDSSDTEMSTKIKLDQYIKKVPETKSCTDESNSDYLIKPKSKSNENVREWDKDRMDCFFVDKDGEKPRGWINEKEDDRFISEENECRKDRSPMDNRTDEETHNPEFAPPINFYFSGKNKKFKPESSVDEKIDEFLDQFK